MNYPVLLSGVYLAKQSSNSVEDTEKMTCHCRVGWHGRRRKNESKYRHQEVFAKVDVRLLGVIQIEDVTVQTCDFLEGHGRVHSMITQRDHFDWDQRGEKHSIGSRPVSRWPCCSLIRSERVCVLERWDDFDLVNEVDVRICRMWYVETTVQISLNYHTIPVISGWLTGNQRLEGREEDESGGN